MRKAGTLSMGMHRYTIGLLETLGPLPSPGLARRRVGARIRWILLNERTEARATRKAMRLGRARRTRVGARIRAGERSWRLAGVTDVGEMHEPIAERSELVCFEYERVALGTLQGRVRDKGTLVSDARAIARELGGQCSGWFVVAQLMRFVLRRLRAQRRYLAWENLRIHRARGPAAAYDRAMRDARDEEGTECVGGKWKTVGITGIFPVCAEFTDGCEIYREDLGVRTVATIRGLVAGAPSAFPAQG